MGQSAALMVPVVHVAGTAKACDHGFGMAAGAMREDGRMPSVSTGNRHRTDMFD